MGPKAIGSKKWRWDQGVRRDPTGFISQPVLNFLSSINKLIHVPTENSKVKALFEI